ncbi:MAG: SBBP repeat-containing protein [Candidatus Scalinduaceae bacterium]
MKVRMQKYRRCGLCLIIGWVLVFFGTAIPAGFAEEQVTEEWVARYDGPESRFDRANAIAVDDNGNAYVTGFSDGDINTRRDYATVKYGTDSTELWVARYDGTGKGNDSANAIAVDRNGNVYVTGESVGSGTSWDYATVKYDKDGNQKWVARYDGTGKGDDFANAIAVDGDGNVYVTGESWGGSGTSFDYATVKYNTDGNELWVARYNGLPASNFDFANAIAVDGDGNVYVTGESWGGSGTSFDYATVKYDKDGNQKWVARYDGSGLNDEANAIAMDRKGNVYVTGESSGSGNFKDYATVKYASDHKQGDEPLWVARYDGPENNHDIAQAIAVDRKGNVYVTGYSGVSSNDYATVKYDTDGNQKWVARYDGPGNNNDFARAIAVDDNGDVYVTGESWGGSGVSGTSFDYATVKYKTIVINEEGDEEADEVWVARYDGPGPPASKFDIARAIAVDANGNVYVTGRSRGSVTQEDYTTVKYNQNTPPVAGAGEDQTICPQGASPVQVTLDGSGSFDPDGAPLTYKWTGQFGTVTGDEPIITVPIPPGISNATLVVNDGTLDSDPDTVMIKVQDTTTPVVTAELVTEKLKKKKGCFRVKFTVTDNCDADPAIDATLNDYPVTNGQLVELKHKKKSNVKTDDDGSSNDKSSDDCGDVKFEGPSFTLEVTATDVAGNVGTGSDTFVFPSRHHGDSKSNDDKSSDDDSKSNDDSGSGNKKKDKKNK